MRIFVSWSGARSQVLATSMREWLPLIVEGVEIFHSDDIPKGDSWHSALTEALQDCHVGVLCITPESLRSQWMLFEAGALAHHREGLKLFTYLYGTNQLMGPLSHFQATRFDRDDSRHFAVALANAAGVEDNDSVKARFDSTWDEFESKIHDRMLLPIQQLVPEFPDIFENKKTFHEPFADCTDNLWEKRLERVAQARFRLSQEDVSVTLSSDTYLSGAYSELVSALDRYDMHIGAHLIKRLDFATLGDNAQHQLEEVRMQIVGIVSALQQSSQPPVFREALSFESETATEKRKALIHEMESRLRRAELPVDELLAARDSLSWALDRVIFYLAVGADSIVDIQLEELIPHLRTEEEIARTRNLVNGLQPLYYAVECIDNCLVEPPEPALGLRLGEILDDIERFLEGNEKRDSGDHIQRRIAAIRLKLSK